MFKSGSRAAVLGLVTSGLSAAAAFIGCSDDAKNAPAADASTDNSTADDRGTTPGDGGSDVKADSYVCADTPFDCNAVPDAGGDASSGIPSTDDAGTVGGVPYYLRCAGLYTCWSDKTVATDHRPYAPGMVLWSDGAEKSRFIYLPAGQKIDTTNPDEWVFPVGTKAYKEFKLGCKRVETRRIWKSGPSEWIYSVWQWDATESQARLMNTGAIIPGTNAAVYEIPANNQCAGCHSGHTDKFLSLDAWGLGTPQAQGVTLAQLNTAYRPRIPPWPTAFTLPQDATGKFDKAQSFFYNNCGFCHKPSGSASFTGLFFHLSAIAAVGDGGTGTIPADQTPVYLTAVDQPHTNLLGTYPPLSGYKRIVKGNASLSVVPLRDTLSDPDGGIAPGQMPPVLRRAVDDAGTGAVIDWINTLQ